MFSLTALFPVCHNYLPVQLRCFHTCCTMFPVFRSVLLDFFVVINFLRTAPHLLTVLISGSSKLTAGKCIPTSTAPVFIISIPEIYQKLNICINTFAFRSNALQCQIVNDLLRCVTACSSSVFPSGTA